jgi:hypothetical protein
MSNLEEEFKIILEFAKNNSDLISYSKKAKYGKLSQEHINFLQKKFEKGRHKSFKVPNKAPDSAVYDFLRNKFNYTNEEIQLIIKYHKVAMGAENIIGHYLEEFINDNLTDKSWIWCSGNILNKIDFIQKIKIKSELKWRLLQIKNSSNTENSSSKTVRDNTEIEMWFRRVAKKIVTFRWNEIQKIIGCNDLTEEKFLKFLEKKARK